MSSGARALWSVLMALALGIASSSDVMGADEGLAEVMLKLAAVPSSRAHFAERRTLSLLTTPLESSGTLSYTRPDRLERTTLYPSQQRMSVAGDKVTVEQDGQTRSFTLGDTPEVTALIESIRSTLSGDLVTLEKYYDVVFKGAPDRWELRLAPKDARVKALVRSITIAGRNATIETVDTEEQGGDRTIMAIVADRP